MHESQYGIKKTSHEMLLSRNVTNAIALIAITTDTAVWAYFV